MKIIIYQESGLFGFSDETLDVIESMGFDVDNIWEAKVRDEIRSSPEVIEYVENHLDESQPRDTITGKMRNALRVVEIPDGSHWIIEVSDVGYENLHYSQSEIKSM